MRQENDQQEQDYISLDFSYIYRRVLRNALVIIMSACIAGVISYIFLDNYLKDTYTASVNLSVIARDNSSGRLNEPVVSAAVTRSLNVLNSDTLKEQILKSEETGKLSGDLIAERVGNTNLITMKAMSASAENSFRLLRAALDNYPLLSIYFESGYLVKNLNNLSAGSITETSARPGYYAAIAALIVLAAGAGLTGFMCLFTNKIYNEEQAASILDMDVLGSLHYIKKKKGQKTILISEAETDISYSEEIDKVVTRIQERMDSKRFKTLMISSVQENEGKSTVAANIALNLEKRGKKVMLIDADFRRPALAKIFDKEVEDNMEFANYLKGKRNFEQVVYQEEKPNGISFLWQKKPIAEPDKLLEEKPLKEVLQKAAAYMDYVILDTPPIGIVRDAEIVAGFSDAVLMVIKQDHIRAVTLNDVIDMLDDTGASVLGGVLNMAKGQAVSNNRKNRYSKYYYGYGKEYIKS